MVSQCPVKGTGTVGLELIPLPWSTYSRWPHNPCPSPPGLHEPPIPKFAWAPLLEGVMKPPPVMKSLHGGGVSFHAFTGTAFSISTAAIATRSPPAKSAGTSLAIALCVLLIVVFLLYILATRRSH